MKKDCQTSKILHTENRRIKLLTWKRVLTFKKKKSYIESRGMVPKSGAMGPEAVAQASDRNNRAMDPSGRT